MNNSDIQRLFGPLPGLFLVLKPDDGFTIVGASEEYLSVTYTTPAIFGRKLFDVFPDNPQDPGADGVQKLDASLREVMATRKPHVMAPQRYDLRAPGKEEFLERYWTAMNAPVLDAHGEVEYLLLTVEVAAAKGKRDAVAILESITEGFFTLDRQWCFDYVNAEAYRILDKAPGELTGKVLWAVYPGMEGTEFEHRYKQTMLQREKTSFTAFYPDHERWYDVTTFPAPEGMAVYFRDVTAQRSLLADRDQVLAESERQRRIYETALNSTPDFVYVFDLDHRALYANDALLKTWGVTEVRGKTWMDLGYEQWHADMHDRELDQVIQTRAPIRGEIPFTGTTGTRMYDYIFAPVFDAAGEVVAVAGTTRDITDRQAAEQSIQEQATRLAASDRAKDDFLATLSHELRNPLAPLRSAISLLRRGDLEGDKLAKINGVMERQVNHMVRLVDDLLEVSRISRGVLSLRSERVELAALVKTAVETSNPLIQSAGHQLLLDVPLEPLWLVGDAVRLAQVISNLLNNAASYTDAGGTITLTVERQDDKVCISVRDTGIGIEPAAIPHMFEMFSRGNRDSARNQGGLGIGLALARRLTEMHQGTLEARSEGLGKGTEFTICLPLAHADSSGAQENSDHDVRLDKTRVLVVDDNVDAGDTLAVVLDMLGAEVRVARDGAQALEVFADYRPSVVLLDIGMPGMNGYEVARAIRSRFAEHPAILVALTGWGQEDDLQRAKEAGFNHHLLKPAEIDALQQLLADIESPKPVELTA
ncbi:MULTISPECIES: PAS domain-containing protein [unclassified Polaromonas]|uniref:hybrid sensor histidine kinase/response regulator n=1 Tax=unclassified Polaromonas TaxID=2638319 RepID=UPI000F095C3E|nr:MULTISPECIES: PAS domain-containing protein [unclassified Polaromonas]AYQ29633.1 response regulator [Polaromonas sp. SP1]QGJ19252.1 PAS domain-containing protein [Polaromonas sp. Pch-P]